MDPEQEITFRYNSLENMQNVIRALDLKASFLLLGFASLPIVNVEKLVGWLYYLLKLQLSWSIVFAVICTILLYVSWLLFLFFLIITIKPLNLNFFNDRDYQERKASIFFVIKPRVDISDLQFQPEQGIQYHLIRQQIALGEILNKKRKRLQIAFICLIPITIFSFFIIVFQIVK